MNPTTLDMIASKFGDSPEHAARWTRTLFDIVSLPTAADCPDCNGCGVDLAQLMDHYDADDVTDCTRCSGTGIVALTPHVE